MCLEQSEKSQVMGTDCVGLVGHRRTLALTQDNMEL